MLKHIAILFLFLALFVQTFHKALIVSGYYTNTEAYAKKCINKAKPQLHCNGKCQMMKKLKQEDKKDQQNPVRRINNQEEVLSSKSFFASIHNRIISLTTIFKIFSSGKPIKMATDFFHPPGS